MKNEFGVELTRAGYAPSIMQRDDCVCANCGRRWGAKMDRHEPWGAANRQKSKELGLWVTLCHFGCHEGPGSVHDDGALARQFRKDAQRAAMLCYGWSTEEWIRRFGKSELSEAEAARIIQGPEDAAKAQRSEKNHPGAQRSGSRMREKEQRSARAFPPMAGMRHTEFATTTEPALPY